MKIRIYLFIAAILLLSGVYTLSNYSFIEIALPADSSDMSVTINKIDGDKQELKAQSGTIKRLVKKGIYQVEVSSDGGSYFKSLETKGFLTTSSTEVQLTEQRERTYTGNNPAPCIYKIVSVLASGVCEGSLDEVNMHVPASNNSPTYVRALTGPSALVEDVFTLNNQTYILLLVESEVDGEGSYHAYFPVQDNGVINASLERKLAGLNGSYTYKIKHVSDGLLVYSLSPLELNIYKDINQSPIKINSPKPTNDLQAVAIDEQDNVLAIAFSNYLYREINKPGLEAGTSHSSLIEKDGRKSTNNLTEIVVFNQTSEISRKTLKKEIGSMIFCSVNTLCIVDNNSAYLSSLNINDKLEEHLRINEVSGLAQVEDKTIVIRNSGAYEINATSWSGYTQYKLSDYTYCGVTALDVTYTLCIAGVDAKTSLLQINPSKPSSDFIDKKIAALGRLSAVKNISIYGKYIDISPHTGDPELNREIGGFEYNPNTIQNSKNVIDSEISKLQFDSSKYILRYTTN